MFFLSILLHPFFGLAVPSSVDINSVEIYQCPQLSATATLSADLSSIDISYKPESDITGSQLDCLTILKLSYENDQQLTVPKAIVGSGETDIGKVRLNWGNTEIVS